MKGIEGRGTPKRSILIFCESPSASPRPVGLKAPPAASGLPRHVRRFLSGPAPHSGPSLRLSLKVGLPQPCRSTKRAGLWGAHTPVKVQSLLRRSGLPSL